MLRPLPLLLLCCACTPADGTRVLRATPEQEAVVRQAIADMVAWTGRSPRVREVAVTPVSTWRADSFTVANVVNTDALRAEVFYGMCALEHQQTGWGDAWPELFSGAGIPSTLHRTASERVTEDVARTCRAVVSGEPWVQVARQACGVRPNADDLWRTEAFSGPGAALPIATSSEQSLGSVTVSGPAPAYAAVAGDRLVLAGSEVLSTDGVSQRQWTLTAIDLSGQASAVPDVPTDTAPTIDTAPPTDTAAPLRLAPRAPTMAWQQSLAPFPIDGADLRLAAGLDDVLVFAPARGEVWRAEAQGLVPTASVPAPRGGSRFAEDAAGWWWLEVDGDTRRLVPYAPDSGAQEAVWTFTRTATGLSSSPDTAWVSYAGSTSGLARRPDPTAPEGSDARDPAVQSAACCGTVDGVGNGQLRATRVFDESTLTFARSTSAAASDRWSIDTVRCANESNTPGAAPPLSVVGPDRRLAVQFTPAPDGGTRLDITELLSPSAE